MTCENNLQKGAFTLKAELSRSGFKTCYLPGKGKKGDFSSCGESLFGTGLVGILLAKPLTVGFSVLSCGAGFVTLMVDFFRLFHRPSKCEIKNKFKGKLNHLNYFFSNLIIRSNDRRMSI